jgi:hypothetical protein
MSEAPRQHYGITLAVLALAALSYALLQTMVAPALPEIQRELDASTTSVTWALIEPTPRFPTRPTSPSRCVCCRRASALSSWP